MSNTELYHWGIKGQKWGIRRYQNADGTLTNAGRARYNSNGTRKNALDMTDDELNEANRRLQAEQQYNQLTGRKFKSYNWASDTALRVGASVVSSLGVVLLTNALNPSKTLHGKDLLKKVLSVTGTVAISSLAGSFGANAKKE